MSANAHIDRDESYQLLDVIRSLDAGDHIEVSYRRPHQREKTLRATVTTTGRGQNPLVDLDPDDRDEGQPRTSVTLEYDEHYSDGSPYNLRMIARKAIDGSSVVGIEVL